MICIWILLCAFCACPQGVCSRWWMEMFLNFATMCFLYVFSKNLGQSMQNHTDCICYIFLQCAYSKFPQIDCPRKGKVTLVVLVFSSVCYQMCPQVDCLRRDKFTLVAFIWLFTSVRFQMSLQIACCNRCKPTQVAFVWLFSTVFFHMRPQMACVRRCIITQVALVWFSPLYIYNPFIENLLCGIIVIENSFHLHQLARFVPRWC